MFRFVAVVLLFCLLAYMVLWLPLSLLFGASNGRPSSQHQWMIVEPGEDAFKHFAGSRDCGITQSDIYLAPWPMNPKVSPFCKNRATLLDALSGGGRYGWDEPFVGKGCTYRWFSTSEICMILERFNAISFIGDDVVQSVYAAFNVLLREDLALGGVQQWIMSDQDRMSCKCGEQFLNPECTRYAVKNQDEVKKNEGSGKGGLYFCARTPHAYIRVESVPASTTSQTLFKDLTYSRPNPWQPSPLIFSFSHGSSFDVAATTRAMEEWHTIATGAERNIPMLFLGPPAFSTNKTADTPPKERNSAVWSYQKQVSVKAKTNHFDVLSLYNLTMQASTPDGQHFGEAVALVEAMMVINWLSKLDTS
ncbi:uncharacterized protein K444DRAFT_640065 [Hyaloscypha bicolor E]|uniref:Uncharacterized protein n=1 Tax=Hyaloscypha bicolor E TaxID=1095630 RepID=A0A2J6TSV7_9HELO|nr:uncharacterized protein K444DRAFT_640065 [Hyaloscypha bicolor E]PMD66107.1 hypothetical protein K444DRAFT_640065 [Hyaloscypha bicolor E]